MIDDLIRRLFRRPPEERTIFDMRGRDHPSLRVLLDVEVPNGDAADGAWLERMELRSPERIAELIRTTGFLKHGDAMKVMLVDARCGLIRTELIATPLRADPDDVVGQILRMAASCDAHGIILATHDPATAFARAWRWSEIHNKLHRKGEAIEVFLLDHFIVTTRGLRRLRTARWAKRA